MKRIFDYVKKRKQLPPIDSGSQPCSAGAYEVRPKELGKLHRAAARGDPAQVRKALRKRSIDERDGEQRTALHLACANGHVDVVRYLVENKCNLNLLDNDSRSPLMKAVQCQQEECVALLLEHGADLNLADADGNTALHLAVISPNTSVVGLLLEHNADIDAQNKEGYTPLILAISEQHEEIVEFLLEKGADVHVRVERERTPLMIAASVGDRNLIKALRRYGADVSHKDASGWTAEDYAIINGHLSLSKELTENEDWENTGQGSAGGAQGVTVQGTPCQAGTAGFTLGAPAVDRGGMQQSPNQTSRTGKSRKAIDDLSQEDSISSEKEGSYNTWPTSEEEGLDFTPKKLQKPNLKLLKNASQQFRKKSDGNGSRIESPKSPKKSLKQRNTSNANLNKGEHGEYLNQDVSDASSLEKEESEEEHENDNESEDEDDEEEGGEEDEDLAQDEEEEEDLEDEEIQSNNILEQEQGEETEPEGEINQELKYFSNAKCEGEAWCGTGDVCDDDKISKKHDEEGKESVDTPVSFIAGCFEGLQENVTSASPKKMNNEVCPKSVPKQVVFQNRNNLQDTRESWNRKGMIRAFHRNVVSFSADSKMTDQKEEIPQPLLGSCSLEKKSSFCDGFESDNNPSAAAKGPSLESQRLSSLILEGVDDEYIEEQQDEGVDDEYIEEQQDEGVDDNVCEALKQESENLFLNRQEDNLRAAFHSSAKEELSEQEEEEEQEKDNTGEELQTAIVEDVENSLCSDSHQVHNASKDNADALPAVEIEEEEGYESPWDDEVDFESLRNVSSNVLFPVADRHEACSQIVSGQRGNGECSGSIFRMSTSSEKEDIKDAIENSGEQDKHIIETTNLILKTAHENQTDRAEISRQEALAENEESLSADKRLSPEPWEERYERMWITSEKRELKENFKNITAELKALFGEINETRKTSLVDKMSEEDFSEGLKTSHVVSSCLKESSNKLESKAEFRVTELKLGGSLPKMEIEIPSLCVLPDQNKLNANVEDTWSTNEEDDKDVTGNTKVHLAKGEEKKIPTMEMEEEESGSSRNVEESPEYSLRHSLKTCVLADVSNILPKIRPVSTSNENALLMTERKLGKDSEFNDVPKDCLTDNKNVGETETENVFANAQQSCGTLKGNLDEELKQDLERFKSKVGMLQIVFQTLEKEKAQLQTEVEKGKSKQRCFKTQEVARQEDRDKLNTPPGNVTNEQMKRKHSLRKNGSSEMENESTTEDENFSSEESKFALNAKVTNKNKRRSSKQKDNQQKSSSSGNHLQVLDDSTFSETSQDEGRPAAKTGSEKKKVSTEMDITDDLHLTQSSDMSEDVELLSSTCKEAMLLLEQLSVDHMDSAIVVKISKMLLEYEQMIGRQKNRYTALKRKVRKLESEKEESQLIVEETQDLKSVLAQKEVQWKSDIQSFRCALKQEEEKRLRVEALYEKTRENLRRKEDQYCKELEEKQQLVLSSSNLEMELVALRKLLKQVEEERDEKQRQLSQEKSARALQEGILNSHLWREKELEKVTRTVGKKSEEYNTEREKDLLYKNQLLQDEISVLRHELDQVRLTHQEEEGKYLEENETLKEKNEDLKKELKMNEEALTQTVLQYNGQLNLLKTESAVLTSKLEQTKESKDRLEVEIESFRSRLNTTVQELERHQSSKSDVECTLQKERDEWLRLQDKLHRDLSVARESNRNMSQQLTIAESKASSLENKLHQLKQTFKEKTLLLEITQKELSQAQCQVKESDHARQLEKDQISKFQIKQESMQERLAQLQSENLLLRQQLEDMQNKGIIKEKAMTDVQDRFNDIFDKLRADAEKQVYLMEERNKELNAKCSELREQVFKYETDKVEREGMIRQLQQELANAFKKQSMSEASLEVTTRYRSDLEEEKLHLQKELEKLKTKLQELEEQHLQSEHRIHVLKTALENKERESTASSQKLQDLLLASSVADTTRKQLEEHVQRLEIENARLEATVQQQNHRIEALQRDLQASASVHNRLEDFITSLRTTEVAAEDHHQQQCESQRKKVKKPVELKCPEELPLDQEMKTNIELQEDYKRLKRLLSRVMKKLRMYEERELSLEGGMNKRYSEMVNDVVALRTQIGELTHKLEIESRKCMQLETQNQDLREELSTMQEKHEKREKIKCRLQEEMANLKHRMKTDMVDHSEMEKYKKEVEERADQEIKQKLQEVNMFLQAQAASQDRIEQIRASHHASLTNELQQRIRDLERELDRNKKDRQDSIFQKESTPAEVERYKELYLEEVKIRRRLANKLERADERLAETNAKLLQERCVTKSLIANSIISGGLAASRILYATEPGHLGNNLALNRSASLGGSFLSPARNTLASRSTVEAYVAKVHQDLDQKIAKELEQATAELGTESPGASPVIATDGSSKNFLVDQDQLSRAIQEYRSVLTNNYLI